MNLKYLKKEIFLRSTKILNIGWATVGYFIFAVISLYLLELIYGKFDKEKYEKLETRELIYDLIIYLWIIGIITYIVRNIFLNIPFPLDGIMGYEHRRVKEVVNATVFSIFIISLNPRIQGYYNLLRDRLSKY